MSVPTPSKSDGSISLKILTGCLSDISSIAEKTNSSPIILLRSTIIPGTSSEMQKRFPHLKIVFNPEFLTERSAYFDFLSQTRFVLGGEKKMLRKKLKLFINIVLEEKSQLSKQILNPQS